MAYDINDPKNSGLMGGNPAIPGLLQKRYY